MAVADVAIRTHIPRTDVVVGDRRAKPPVFRLTKILDQLGACPAVGILNIDRIGHAITTNMAIGKC